MQALIIGGGISGLACAWRLRQLGVAAVVLEQSDRPGGLIDSVEQDGFFFDRGPQSLLASAGLLELVSQLGLDGDLLRADRRAPRFVLVGGRLHRVPMAPPALLATSLLSARTKFRLLTEPFRRTTPPPDDESVAAFVRRKFGPDLLDRLAAPFVSGVYAGDPERLSLRSAFPMAHQWELDYGSVLRGAMKSRPAKDAPRPVLCSFRGGLAALPRVLAARLGHAVRCGCRVVSLTASRANGRGSFRVVVARAGQNETLEAPALVLACGATAAAPLLHAISPSLADDLSAIEYAPVAVVSAGYRREQVGHSLAGFGFLVPRTEGLRVLGTVWNSSLFPGRAPDGMVSLASFLGGATDPALLDLRDEDILARAAGENARILNIDGRPVAALLQRYTRALPQYNLGHAARLERIRAECARIAGLFIAGNFLEGPSVAHCVEQAVRTAEAAAHVLT